MQTHGAIRRAILLVFTLLLAGRADARPPRIVGQERPGTMEDWKARSVFTQERLQEGDYKKAYGVADGLVREMIARIEGGESAGPVLGKTVLLRALAEAGQGRNREAAWDWFAAKAVDPGLRVEDLTTFGAVGESLRAVIAAAPPLVKPEPDPSAETSASAPRKITNPAKIAGMAPVFPRGASTACRQGNIVIASMIDEKGTVQHPELVSSPGGPVLALASLEAVKGWRFRPARFDGKITPVYYTLTIHFSLGTCDNPAAIPQIQKGKATE
jgi:TonB family protein